MRSGLSFIGYISWVAILSMSVTLSWGVYANWSRDRNGDGQADGFTLHVQDAQWWQFSREKAVPVVQQARLRAIELQEQMWGEEGSLLQAAQELVHAPVSSRTTESSPQAAERLVPHSGEQHSPDQPGRHQMPGESPQANIPQPMTGTEGSQTTLPAQPDASRFEHSSPRQRRLEERIAYAHDHFTAGMASYRQAQPDVNGDWGETQWQAVQQAKESFVQVRQLLQESGTLASYAELVGHRHDVLAFARNMNQQNEELLLSLQRLLP